MENYDISTYGLTDRCSASELQTLIYFTVGIIEFESITFCVSGRCSNQLSYTPIWSGGQDSNLRALASKASEINLTPLPPVINCDPEWTRTIDSLIKSEVL